MSTGTIAMTDAVIERVQRRLADDAAEPTPTALARALRAESTVLVSDAEMLRLIRMLQRELVGAGPLAELLSSVQEFFRPHAVAAIQMDRREAVVARHDQLRLADLLSEGERFAIRRFCLRELTPALMDLCDDDQRNREMIQLSEFAVECCRSLRRLEA